MAVDRPQDHQVRIEAVRGSDAFARVRDEWNDLATRVDAPLFIRAGWIERWFEAFGGGSPVLLVARRDGAMAGVLPLYRRAGMTLTMSNVHSPLFDVTADDPEVAVALWQRAIELSGRRLSVFSLRDAPFGLPALDVAAGRAGRRPWVRSEWVVPHIDVAGTDWDDYSSARGKSLRRTVRRHRGRLEEVAPLCMEVVPAERIDAALTEALQIEESGWKGDQNSAMASRDDTLRFYTEIARWLASHDWLRLMILRHGDRAIAFEYIVDDADTWYPLKAGYDDALAEHSPGVIMQWDVLEAAFSQGIAKYDYCGEARDYTKRWASDGDPARRIEVFGGALGLADRLALVVARPALKRLRDRLRD